jgi:hypothetical protein
MARWRDRFWGESFYSETTRRHRHDDTLTVTTDKDDYSPGMTAIFTASNVGAGDSVEFVVAHLMTATMAERTSDDYLSWPHRHSTPG